MSNFQHIGKNVVAISLGFYLLTGVATKVNAEQLLYSDFHPTDAHYLQEAKDIQEYRIKYDLNSLVKIADAIQTEWSQPKDRSIYFDLSKALVEAIARCEQPSVDNYQPIYLARKYLLLAMEKHGEVPLDVEANMLPYLAWPDNVDFANVQVTGDDWSHLRSDHMKLWFDVWRRMNKALKQPVDFKELILVPLPFVGDPDDPKAIAEHEKAVQVNNQKIQVRQQYHTIAVMKMDFSGFAEHEITTAYSTPPFNTNELKAFMDTAEIDDATQQRILTSVRTSRAKAKT